MWACLGTTVCKIVLNNGKKNLYFGIKILAYPTFAGGFVFCNSTDTRK